MHTAKIRRARTKDPCKDHNFPRSEFRIHLLSPALSASRRAAHVSARAWHCDGALVSIAEMETKPPPDASEVKPAYADAAPMGAYGIAPNQDGAPVNKERNPQATGYRDLWALVLFWVHFLIIFILAVTLGASAVGADNDVQTVSVSGNTVADEGSSGSGNTAIVGGIFLLAFLSAIFAAIWLKVMFLIGEKIITVSIFAGIGFLFLIGLIMMSVGQVPVGVLFIIFSLIGCCYYYCVRNRIAFAAANLKVACDAVSAMPATVYAAFAQVGFQVLWCVLWSLALFGAASSSRADTVSIGGQSYEMDQCTYVEASDNDAVPVGCYCGGSASGRTPYKEGSCTEYSMNGGVYFIMLISFYWGATTIANVIHATVAGATATWWFETGVGNSAPVWGAYRRAMTTSFGSIAYGSLLVAIIKAVRSLVRAAMDRAEGPMVALLCVLQCLLSILESLLEIFNRFAFCYVGIYGHDFKAAGKAVWNLFKDRGWTAIINDDLVDMALNFGCLMIGVLAAGIGFGYGSGAGMNTSIAAGFAFLSFLIGFVLTSVAMTTVSSAVATVFVLFAEERDSFARTHPELHQHLVASWNQFHPGALRADYAESNMAAGP